MGEAMQRIGQPAVMGQLIAGILLGPSVFGAIWPEAQRAVFATNPEQKSMIDAISQLGILILLLLTGMETEVDENQHIRRSINPAAVRAAAGKYKRVRLTVRDNTQFEIAIEWSRRDREPFHHDSLSSKMHSSTLSYVNSVGPWEVYQVSVF